MKKIFDHKDYRRFGGVFSVTPDGEVTNTNYGRRLKLHRNKGRSEFVRLAVKMKYLSICVGKLILLTYRGKDYRPGMIAVRKDHRKRAVLGNLFWGTRSDQTAVQMKSKKHRARVSSMARKYHETDFKDQFIKRAKRIDMTDTDIANLLGISHGCVSLRKKALGLSQPGSGGGRARMDEVKVRRLRKMHGAGRMRNTEIMREFGISSKQFYRIVNRENWKHVK